jgi:hypothetical protein
LNTISKATDHLPAEGTIQTKTPAGNHDPQNKVGCLGNGDDASFAVPEQPLQQRIKVLSVSQRQLMFSFVK